MAKIVKYDDFRTMRLLDENIRWYKTKDPSVYGEVVKQHQSNLKDYFRKVG